MNIIFTICSNNYLAQAKILIDSASEFSPTSILVIGLVDERSSQIDYDIFLPAVIVPIAELEFKNKLDLYAKYNIVELNTCVKASYFKYLSHRFPQVKKIIYFDPDIKIFSSLEFMLLELDTAEIILTPHILTAILPDEFEPQENIFLNYGLYNLGFLGLRTHTKNVNTFLDWWEERILHNGFANVAQGFFVDQLPVNFVPIFFKNVNILRAFGYNMAPWNLHERVIVEETDDNLLINDGSPLYFYHFSAYDYKKPDQLCKDYYTRFNFKKRPDLVKIYADYKKELFNNGVERYEKIPCAILKSAVVQPVLNSSDNMLKRFAKQFVPPIYYILKSRFLKHG